MGAVQVNSKAIRLEEPMFVHLEMHKQTGVRCSVTTLFIVLVMFRTLSRENKIVKMILHLAGCLLPVLLLSCVRHQDTAELLRRYNQAANRHDISALRAMLADDIVWVLGRDTLIGKDAALGPHEFDTGAEARVTIKSSVVKGDTVEFVLEETNGYMDTLGIPSVVHYPRFIFRDGLLIRKEPVYPSLYSPMVDSIDQRWNQWIRSAHPEAHVQIIKPNGGINFNRKTGELLLHLAHEWKQSMAK